MLSFKTGKIIFSVLKWLQNYLKFGLLSNKVVSGKTALLFVFRRDLTRFFYFEEPLVT